MRASQRYFLITILVPWVSLSIRTSSIRLSIILIPQPRFLLDFSLCARSGGEMREGSKPYPASATPTSR